MSGHQAGAAWSRDSRDRAVDKARSPCGRLRGQAPADQLISAAKAEFSGGVPAVSDQDAQRILSAIGTNGFCR
ncbi:hypothetical protein [Arthrobacter sp. ES3-54]|uniref:hypothetical protein n=1 Tax=Arthrobacter sp. ES3-54 TaxID=1502991 RepID=UPI002406D8B7|nr:hypothetical protein [Arthrobacter sp. ES3-54]MDF9748691.1 hypothetical protein [Arthrobacter sp. ES3-54]